MSRYFRANQDIDTSLLALEMMWRGINDSDIKNQIGVPSPQSFLEVINGRTINYMVEKKSAHLFFSHCFSCIAANPALLSDLRQKTIANCIKMRKYSREILANVHNLSSATSVEVIRKIGSLETESGKYGAVIAFSDFYGDITNKLIEIISKRSNLIYPLYLYSSILSTPVEKSLTEQAYGEIQAGNQSDRFLLQEYFWLDQGYIGRGLDIHQLKKIRRTAKNESVVTRENLEKELNLSNAEKKYFDIAKDIVFLKALRADMRQCLYTILNKIVDHVAEKFGLEAKYLEALLDKELIQIIQKNTEFLPNIYERFNHSVIFQKEDGDYRIITGENADSFIASHVLKEKIDNYRELKGLVAQPGFAKGEVRLIFGPQHIAKITKGDILVSTATSPQLLPAMTKASAFITDVGGMISHAAIVARELKKPCIVGTKYATQILKDGDIVEVDANKGVVKILQV